MSANVNKVILIGRLGADPELRRTQNDLPVTSFSIAVNRLGKDNGVDFIDIVAWRHQAEFVSKYFRKGNPIFVEGKIQVRPWTDNGGNSRRSVEVVADDVQFVESKKNADTVSSDYVELDIGDDDLPY